MINWYNIIGAILLVLAIVTVFVTDMLDLGILAYADCTSPIMKGE